MDLYFQEKKACGLLNWRKLVIILLLLVHVDAITSAKRGKVQ